MGLSAEAQAPLGISETTRRESALEATQKEKARACRATPTGNCASSPSPGFRGSLTGQPSQLIPHTGTQWRGWLSAVTSVKTQPSSGNSLYFVLLLESNYHLVVCYREALFLCASKHKMQQFGEQAGSFQSLEQKGGEIILFLPKESHAHWDSPGFGTELVELSPIKQRPHSGVVLSFKTENPLSRPEPVDSGLSYLQCPPVSIPPECSPSSH